MADGKIVSLAARRLQPVQDVVDRCESLLSYAKSGELRDIAACGTMADGTVTTAFSTTENAIMRIAAVHRLAHTLHIRMDPDTVDVTYDPPPPTSED